MSDRDFEVLKEGIDLINRNIGSFEKAFDGMTSNEIQKDYKQYRERHQGENKQELLRDAIRNFRGEL